LADSNLSQLISALNKSWPNKPLEKVSRYINKFFDCQRVGLKISGRVNGNHGIYTVTIQMKGRILSSACSCYFWRHGSCHHCEALAKTFTLGPNHFQELEIRKLEEKTTLDDLKTYLRSETLDNLLTRLKSRGITQTAFAKSIGMNTRHLSSIKSSELRNRFYNELGATKLAVMWALEHLTDKKE
jgi:uncharacterized Zn finger protein